MAKVSPQLDTKPRTALHPFTRDVVADLDRVIQERVLSWVFLRATDSWSTTDFYGKRIAAGGCSFEGSLRTIFWRFADPFLEDAVRSSIAKLTSECERRRIDLNAYLPELQDLLHRLIERTFNQMADVDRRLRGNGYPQTVQPENVTGRIANFTRFANERIAAAGVSGPADSGEMVSIKPGFWGVSIDLRRLWRRIRSRYQPATRVGPD